MKCNQHRIQSVPLIFKIIQFQRGFSGKFPAENFSTMQLETYTNICLKIDSAMNFGLCTTYFNLYF